MLLHTRGGVEEGGHCRGCRAAWGKRRRIAPGVAFEAYLPPSFLVAEGPLGENSPQKIALVALVGSIL